MVLGAHFLLLAFFENFNFWTTLFSKMTSNFWRLLLKSMQIFQRLSNGRYESQGEVAFKPNALSSEEWIIWSLEDRAITTFPKSVGGGGGGGILEKMTSFLKGGH